MIQQLKKPLVSTSANISQHNHPHNFANIDENIKIDVDLILNDRLKEEMKEPSSMVKVGSNHNVQVIR
jgi:L-threonylcarbamoyladenylate synthase